MAHNAVIGKGCIGLIVVLSDLYRPPLADADDGGPATPSGIPSDAKIPTRGLLFLFGLIFAYGIWIALRARQNYSRFLVLGLTVNFSLYVFINIAMVMGLIPVVGAPLPLISYGGTSMLSAMIGFGLIMSCSVHNDSKVRR